VLFVFINITKRLQKLSRSEASPKKFERLYKNLGGK
jgi:hypothetical protein